MNSMILLTFVCNLLVMKIEQKSVRADTPPKGCRGPVSCHSFSSPITHSCASRWLIRAFIPPLEFSSPLLSTPFPYLHCPPRQQKLRGKIRKTKKCGCSFVAFLSAVACSCRLFPESIALSFSALHA